jgi:hypothetical protein
MHHAYLFVACACYKGVDYGGTFTGGIITTESGHLIIIN